MGSIFTLLADSVKRHPDQIYIIDKNREWSYKEIYEKVLGLSSYLKDLHIHAEDRVMLYLDNSVEYIISYFAVLQVNGITVPINKNISQDHLQFIIDDISPKVLLTSKMSLKKLNGLPSSESIIKLPIDEWINQEAIAAESVPKEYYSCDADQVAVILYTSGTTMNPKGVMLTHKNLNANTDSIVEYLQLSYEDPLLVTIPFNYAYGNSLILTQTKVGGTLYIDNRAAFPVKILEMLREGRVKGFSTVGSYLHILLKQDCLANHDFANLKYLTVAGEACSSDDIEMLCKRAPHVKVYIMYGQTEASARLSYLGPALLPEKRGSIGRGITGVTLRVVDDEGIDIKPGGIGEIIASGENIMKGYWNNIEETNHVIKNGWLHTGDLATIDMEGYIYIKGRNNDIIKYWGHRISPLEIETVINNCEGVLESAVVEIESNNEKQIKAYVVLKDGTSNEAIIDHFVRTMLPPYKRPHVYQFIDSLPRTTNGKIKRNELRGNG